MLVSLIYVQSGYLGVCTVLLAMSDCEWVVALDRRVLVCRAS